MQRSCLDSRKLLGVAATEAMRVHDLRHTFGQRLRDAGVVEEDRALLLGHAIQGMPQHYATATIAIPEMPDPHGGAPIAVDVPDHLAVIAELPGPAILTMELAASRRAEPNAVQQMRAVKMEATWGP